MSIGLTTFKNHARCPCMVQPKFRFCADEIQVSLLEILTAIREHRRNPPPDLKNYNCGCSFCLDFNARKLVDKTLLFPESNENTFLQHMVRCPKIAFPGTDKLVYQQKCMFGQCIDCNSFRAGDLCFFVCPRRFGDIVKRYRYKEYAVTASGARTKRELKTVSATGPELLRALSGSLEKYLKHHWEYKWLHNSHMTDINNCNKHTLIMQTDFSAVVEMKSQDTLNSAHSNYCQLSCWAVMHSPEILEHGGVCKKYLSCDHIRAVTPATTGDSKDGDWFCHAMMLTYLLYFYQRTLNHEIRRVILWTDGSPSQYKCRQTFAFEAVILRLLFPNIEV